MQLPGEIKRGRPKSRYLDVVKEDMQGRGAREDEVFDRSYGESTVVTRDGKLEDTSYHGNSLT